MNITEIHETKRLKQRTRGLNYHLTQASKMLEIKITVNGVERTYSADYDTLYNNDWNEIIQDLLDSAKSYEQGE